MKKIIVADAHSNLYEFDGTKMKSLGTPKKFKDVWNGRIFQIGYNYYFKDKKLGEIAKEFGLTEARICQIHAQALNSLRPSMTQFKN